VKKVQGNGIYAIKMVGSCRGKLRNVGVGVGVGVGLGLGLGLGLCL
jgi:hypothetical protein